MLEENVVETRPRNVRVLFEIAAARMAETWLAAGQMCVSAGDMRLAQEFLEGDGWTVSDAPGVRVRLVRGTGRAQEMTREDAVLMALRSLARRV